MDWTPETPGSLPFEHKMAVLNPFDHNNPKYKVFRTFHIVKFARFIAVLLIIGTIINLIFSLTRTSTIVFYSFVLGAFSAGIYGSLVYGVYKEKRAMLIPFLVFQAIFVIVDILSWLALILITAFSRDALLQLGADLLNAPVENTDANVASIRGVAIVFIFIVGIYTVIQAWVFSVIYRFSLFLKDRETSFGFQMEPEFRLDPMSME